MARLGDHLFIATSKLRKNSSTFKHLDIAEKADQASIYIVHLPSGSIMGKLTYAISVDEIYDIQLLPNTRRPNIINTYKDVHHKAVHTPQGSFWAAEKKKDNAPPDKPKS